MSDTLYKFTKESFRTIFHYDVMPLEFRSSDVDNTPSRLDGYNKPKVYYFKRESVKSEKDTYLENYGNPLCEVENHRKTVVIEKEGDKVRISKYLHLKLRKVGKKYFAKEYDRRYLTFNLKTNNIYTTTSSRSIGHKPYRRVRSNNFATIENFIDHIFDGMSDEERLKLTNIFLREIGVGKDVTTHRLFKKYLLSMYIQRNGIKGPDRMDDLLCYAYPGKKSLKKNDNNIVRAVLDRMGLNTKYFVKLLNNYDVDLNTIRDVYRILGPKYTRSVEQRYFEIDSPMFAPTMFNIGNINDSLISSSNQRLTDFDKKNIVKVINDYVKTYSGDYGKTDKLTTRGLRSSFTSGIDDHIRILEKLSNYEPNIKFRATTVEEFDNEHINYSEKYSLYRNSEEIHYMYGDDLVQSIKDGYNGCEYVLLKNDMEYINESTYQSNCVRTYVDKLNSIIISVRKGKQRVTTEFNYQGRCIQKRERFNQDLTDEMKPYVDNLEKIIHNLYVNDKLEPAKVKVINKMTGVETVGGIDEMGKLLDNRRGFDFFDIVNDELDDVLFG